MDANQKHQAILDKLNDHEERIAALESDNKRAKRGAAAQANIRKGKSPLAVSSLNQRRPS